MVDKFLQFWGARRRPAIQPPRPPPPPTTNSTPAARPRTPSPPPATTTSFAAIPTPESQPLGRPTSSPPKKPPPTESQMAGQPNNTSATKTSSSSTVTKSPVGSLKPASPSRRTTQSKSPPQPSSPSRLAPQVRPITSTSSSPSRNSTKPSTPQRSPQPRSPSRLTNKQTPSNSPKERQPNSPSKEESRHIVQEEHQLKAEVQFNGVDNEINGVEKTSFKHKEVKEMPSKSTELGDTTPKGQSIEKIIPPKKLETPTSDDGHDALVELKAKKHDETTKDVKEVAQATKIEANEETKKEEVSDFLNPKPGSKGPITRSEIPTKPDDVHTEKPEGLETKEILPPSQLNKRSKNPGTHDKSTQKSGEHNSLNKDIRDDISKFVNKMAIGDPKNTIGDRKVCIITLAGENRGASMQMGSTLKEGHVHINRGYKIKPDEGAETTTDGEGKSKRKKQFENAKAEEDQPTKVYVNNNAQGINNSIVFNASIREGSPGVHMVVTYVPKESTQSPEKISPLETPKVEFNMSRSEKLTYEPMVRRRCLRGLLMETSDSDPENPEKPRRHGCRVVCKPKENETM